MEAEDLTTQELTTQELTAEDLTTPELTTQDLIADELIADELTADELTADELTADELTADELAADELTAKNFGEFGVAEPICAALATAGITTAFPIQALTLPIALDGHDVIGQARTGTGKTLAFGIPILQHVTDTPRGRRAAPRSLVIVPTRELAIQVADDLRTAAARSDANVVTLYGGRAYEPQIEALATVDVVVGTPGRLLDLSRQGQLDLSYVDILVLDEADRMLDLGFLPDVEAILRLTPEHRQTMLFSATMPSEVVTLARRHLRRPIHIRAEQHDEPAHVPTTDQHVFRAHHLDKIEVLARVLQAEGRGLTIVFCRTRRACDQVTAALLERGFAAAAVHGDLGQSQRERALRAFRSGKIDVLVATDVAARGLDVDDVTHVVNNECPEDEKAYLHRIGRTGRAGRTGIAVTFVDWQDIARWKLINDTLNLGRPDPLETYSTSDHLFAALGIPAGVRGSLPRAQRERAGLEAEDLEDIGETGRIRSRQLTSATSRQSRSRDTRPVDGGSNGSRRREPGRDEASRGGTTRDGSGRVEPGQRQSRETQVSANESGQRPTAARAPRRRTRAGAPVSKPISAVGAVNTVNAGVPVSEHVQAAGPAGGDVPRKRRRSGRGRGGHSASVHPLESQHGSTRPASHAEWRDVTAD